MGTLISQEILYNTDANTKTVRLTYQSLEDYGTECENMANQRYALKDGVFEYSGETVFFWGGINGGGGGTGGGGQGTGADSPLLEVSSASTAEPIENHPAFDDIISSEWDKWNRWKANPEDPLLSGQTPTNSRGFWDPSLLGVNTPGGTLYALYQRGIREYYEPKVVIRQTRFENAAPNLSLVGKIDEPPVLVGGMTNYLLNSGQGRWNGKNGIWENTYEWLGSRKGWPSGLYS
jgi:hypothetical protein